MDTPESLLKRFGHEPHKLEEFSFEVEGATLSLKYFKISSDFKEPTETEKTTYWPNPFFRITLNTPCSVMLYTDREHVSRYWSILKDREADFKDRLNRWETDRKFSLDQLAVRKSELAQIEAAEEARLDAFTAGEMKSALVNKRKQELESNIREHEAIISKPRPALNDDSGCGFDRRLRIEGGPSIAIHKMIEAYEQNKRWWLDGFGVVPRKQWKHVVKDGSHANGIVVVIDYHG